MSANGHSSRNVADDMAALLVLCWEIYTGGTANKLQIAGAHRQSRGIFLGTPALRTMTNAEREEMAERIAYQFVISDMVNQVALSSGDQAQQAQIRQSAAAVMRQRVDIDITRLRLPRGGSARSLDLQARNAGTGRPIVPNKRPAIGGPHGLHRTLKPGCRQALVLDLGRQLAAIRRKLGHHLLVQPDVHAGGIIAVAGVTEFLGKLLAGAEAGIDVKRLHQIDDRGAPCQLFTLGGSRLVHDGCDIDGLCRRRRSRRRSSARGRTASCRRSFGLGTEDRTHDFPENTHCLLPVNLKIV
jgi:hypothetical protein